MFAIILKRSLKKITAITNKNQYYENKIKGWG